MVLVKYGETAGVVLIGGTSSGGEALEWQEAWPIHGAHEGDAHADGVQLEVDLDLLVHQIQAGQPLHVRVCKGEGDVRGTATMNPEQK